MEDTPASVGSTCIHMEWTHLDWIHLDGLKSLDTPGKFGHTWNTGAMEPLLDSSIQLPWISMTHDLTGKDVFWKVVKLTGTLTQGPIPVPYSITPDNVDPRYHWAVMESHAVAGTLFLSSTPGSAVEKTLSFGTLQYGEDTHTRDMSCWY